MNPSMVTILRCDYIPPEPCLLNYNLPWFCVKGPLGDGLASHAPQLQKIWGQNTVNVLPYLGLIHYRTHPVLRGSLFIPVLRLPPVSHLFFLIWTVTVHRHHLSVSLDLLYRIFPFPLLYMNTESSSLTPPPDLTYVIWDYLSLPIHRLLHPVIHLPHPLGICIILITMLVLLISQHDERCHCPSPSDHLHFPAILPISCNCPLYFCVYYHQPHITLYMGNNG